MLDDDRLARKIIDYLGRQPDLPARVVFQLGQARARALTRATAGSGLAGLMRWPSLSAGAGVALVVMGLSYAAWQLYSPAPDLADLDAELLTGALPPTAYLDPGFDRFVSQQKN